MGKSKKYLNNYQIISIILVPLFFILSVLIPETNAKHLIWIALSINLIGDYFFLQTWHKDGITWFRKADKNYSKNLTRKSSDLCLLIIGIKTILLCALIIFVDFDILILDKILTAIMFITSVATMIILHLITKRTYKQVLEIIPKKK